MARHQQTFRLREYHYLAYDGDGSGADSVQSSGGPLSVGDPLRAYLPPGVRFQMSGHTLLIEEAGRPEPVQYVLAPTAAEAGLDNAYASRVQDVIITGEVSTPPRNSGIIVMTRSFAGSLCMG